MQKQNINPPPPATHYRIQVQGQLDESWSQWFDGLTIAFEDDVTTLTGPLTDQAALRGVLDRIWDLNLAVISVNPIELGKVATLNRDKQDEQDTERRGRWQKQPFTSMI